MSKMILITGASTGLGHSIATYLAQLGYVVYGTSRQADLSEQTFRMLTMDVTDSESVQNAVNKFCSRKGG